MFKKMMSLVSVVAIAASLISFHPAKSEAAPIGDANNTILGPNVYVFDPSMPSADITSTAASIFNTQESSQFGTNRYALLFKPGTYNNVDVKVGFYTQVSGLGQNPGDVKINGSMNTDAKWWNGNATLNFWRSLENFSIQPANGTMQWAVAQATTLRRMHIQGNMNLFDFDKNWNAGWASGGYNADTIVDNKIVPASQQQWFSRNSQYASWSNGVWNMVFVGDSQPPTGNFPNPPYTVVDRTPVVREKPYLYIDNAGQYQVFVPSLQTNTKGVTWANGSTPGDSISIDQFYIARPETATAATINNALNQGKNLLFTPGIYHLNDTIRVTRANTVVLGLGFATLIPDTGKAIISVADVDGVKVAGLLMDAGAVHSPVLMEVGTPGSTADHSANPTSLQDLVFRIGGAVVGSADVALQINSNNVIGDHFWIWRADHGAGASWNTNVSKNGLIVNGNDVTIYGLFNEHHREYQTLWNGNGGRVYFYQSEIPYDVPNQADWMSSNGTINGYASYKVADSVNTHEVWGLGVYSFFRDAPIKLNSAIEVPDKPGIKVHHATSIWLAGQAGSEITHVINNVGNRVYANSPSDAMRQTVSEFVGGAIDTQPPTAPTNLKANAASDSQINLTWTASTDDSFVSGYDIYRNGAKIASSVSNSYADAGLASSTIYSYYVIARDGAGNVSAPSNTATETTKRTLLNRAGWTVVATPPGADPTANMLDGSLSTRWSTNKAMAPGDHFIVDMKSTETFNGVQIETNRNNDYARGYEVYVSNDGTTWGSAVASGTGSTKIIVEFDPQTARYIKVVQTDSASNWWSVSEFNVYAEDKDIEAPTAPTNITATAVSTNQINLSWNASTDNVGVTGYEIYRNGAKVATVTTATYTDIGLSPATAYVYTVKALDAAGNASANSNPASATTLSNGVPNAIDRTGWSVDTFPVNGMPANILDGNLSTRWTSGKAMQPGQYIVVDMKGIKPFNRVVMNSTGNNNDYARGFEVYVSNDGTTWGSPLASGTGLGPVITVDLAPANARYIKIVQTGSASNWWSIREFNVYN
ncbi:discoidin domain-containing protein [Paenibacillus paeoniae]|uniref:Fibronectin type III domain-containing protein n=1 Tax=Paenibacillus paeoniae TaxID=2292705 RepID=A0A371PIT2_9BACL|nr:discoidin domain-containing protein [Paenibacillus paeoniae]REK75539.1 hypothetical protein DX130_00120 [Paenibacillus paeoniae]